MAAADALAQARQDVHDEIERFLKRHDAAQSGLIGEHLAAIEKGPGLTAAPLCLAIGRVLGVEREEAAQTAAMVGLAEAAAAALCGLSPEEEDAAAAGSVQARHGLPLALNAADALYALAHLALAEFESAEGGRKLGLGATFDGGTADLWAASLDTSGKVARYFGDSAKVAGAAGGLAGQVAARVAGRQGAALTALSEFGSRACVALSSLGEASSAIEVLASSGLSPREREALSALVRREGGAP